MTAPAFDLNIDYRLHPKQGIAFLSDAEEIFFGGAAGPGKSHLMRVLSIICAGGIPGLEVYLFRRVFDDLIKSHVEGPAGYRMMLAPAVNAGFAKIVDDEIRFMNGPGGTVGSKIFFCHCKDPVHVGKYLSSEIHLLLIDELTQWLPDMYYFLRSRVRAPGLVIPEAFKQAYPQLTFPRICLASNPGGIGHGWVKHDFVTSAPVFGKHRTPINQGGMLRQYIPARLEDNPTLMRDDPRYGDRLSGMGSKELVRAYREGDWDIIAGAYFDDLRRDRHMLPAWTPPAHWTRYRAMDWGSYRPFSVGWYAIAEDELVTVGGEERRFPIGALIRYREWYGVKLDETGEWKPNTGAKMTIEAVTDGILKREMHEKIEDRLNRADPSMWDEDGGPSLIERMWKYRPDWYKPRDTKQCVFHKADNTRIAGWLQLAARFKGDEESGKPMQYVTEDCEHWWRTVPVLQHDGLKVEDVDTDGEDHAGDENRYAAMARPMSTVAKPKEATGPKPWTLDWIIEQDERAKIVQR